MTPSALDIAWLAAHPLPELDGDIDKNRRGRVLLVGGARFVPGALRLSAEAALRAGAGKLQMATVADVAMALGVLVPEAAMIALPADEAGEIGAAALPRLEAAIERCDAFVLGPGMSDGRETATLAEAILAAPREGLSVVLDAAAIGACATLAGTVAGHDGRVVMTPHHGEMSALTGLAIDDIAARSTAIAADVAHRFQAVVVLKAAETVIAAPDGTVVGYPGGGAGLATGGSGDVLAGLAGGLLARGADPLTAAGWAVWLHGEAGRTAAKRIGPLGFLARELPPLVPALMAGALTATS